MPFTFKLATRLARLKHLAVVGAAAAVAAAVIVSCEVPVSTTGQHAIVSQLVIVPHAATLQLNQDQDFLAVGLSAAGDTTPSTVAWSATGGSVTDMGSSGGRHYGRYHASACGTVKVAASSQPDGATDTATVTVTCVAPVALVSVSPAAPTVQAGQTVQLTATPKDANGTPLSGRVVTWSSNNTAVATVDGNGLVTAIATGTATITATSEGQSGTALVTVSTIPVASVTVSPSPASVQQGATVQLSATPKDASGNPLSGRVVTWSSNNTAVARVNGSGLVTGVVAGTATITATSEGQSGTSSVTVTQVPVASVTVTPSPATVTVGLTLQLTATPKDANGTPLSGRVVTWSSSNTGVATVNGSGLVTGVAAGSATITATSEGKNGTSAVTVMQPGACTTSSTAWQNTAFASQNGSFTAQFDATPNGANIDAGTGLSLAAAGSYTDLAVIVRFDSANVIDARNGGGYSAANVIPYTPGTSYRFRLVVDVPSHTYSAYVAPAGGTEATIGTGFAFRTEQSGVTALANWGLTANPGTHTVCNFTITSSTPPVPVASVTVTPSPASVQAGQTVQLTATPKDANGTPLTGRVVVWSSSNTAVATVNGSGLVSGIAAGSATITATSEGQSGTSALTVTPVPVASVAVSPPTATVSIGLTVQLTATPKDANGNPLSGRVVTWSSDNTAVATVSGSGLVTGVAAGTAAITATSEGQSGTASITVSGQPVASVTVSPSPASVQQGATVQLTATPKDANGNPLSGRVVTWSSNNTAVATVNGSGLVRGVTAGSATITATSEGQSGTSAVTVTPVPVASVTVTPSPASVTVGLTVQLTATPKDANGNPLSGRVVTWSSNNTAVATVNGSGLVTGVAAGSATITATSEGKSGTSAVTVTTPGTSQFGHVFIVTEENTDYVDVNSSSMPYLTGLAAQYGLATQYYANTHPSIGNYFELATGQVLTNNDGSSTIENVPNVVRSLVAAGKTWKSYAESIPNACYLGGDTGNYARKHNVFALLSDVANDPTGQACNIVPFTQFATDMTNGALPTFSNIVPNLCNDAHDCSLGTADSWLRTNIAPLIASPVFQQNGLLIIVFDESGGDNTNGGGRVVWVAVSPKSKPGYQSTTLYQHPSTLRLILKGLGVTTYPGAAATAPDMDELFNP